MYKKQINQIIIDFTIIKMHRNKKNLVTVSGCSKRKIYDTL